MSKAIPMGSIVYIRYKDHVLHRNTPQPLEDTDERETVGWLTKENNELICIHHDRTIKRLRHSKNKISGLVLLKSCILEIRALPLQTAPRGSLSCPDDKPTTAEYAPQTAKRKTQPK